MKLRVLHLSDLHIDDDFEGNPKRIHGQEGHDVEALVALSRTFEKLESIDLVLVSGDLSRHGSQRSLDNAHNFLLNTAVLRGGRRIGLDLVSRRIPTIVVRGNHDLWNGEDGRVPPPHQHDVKNFEAIAGFCGDAAQKNAEKPVVTKNGVPVYVLCIETCGFPYGIARGDIRESERGVRVLPRDGIRIAVLHHHVIQPPSHSRHRRHLKVGEKYSELIRKRRALQHVLAHEIDVVAFGHTHDHYFDVLSRRLMVGILESGKVRGKRRLLRNIRIALSKARMIATLGKYRGVTPPEIDEESEPGLVSYERLFTMNSQVVSMDDSLNYWWLRFIDNRRVREPVSFSTPSEFHQHLVECAGDSGLPSARKEIDREPIAVSMAATPCQLGARYHAFTVINIDIDDASKRLTSITPDVWIRVDGGDFIGPSQQKSLRNNEN